MANDVLDFTKKRNESIENKRRSFERILFQNFLGAHQEINKDGSVFPVTLVDISKEGCLFQVPWDASRNSKMNDGEELTLRMYFTNKSYVPVIMNIKYGREFVDQDGSTFMQYGCEFDTSMPSFEAMASFIDFLYKFAEHSTVDKAEKRVFFL